MKLKQMKFGHKTVNFDSPKVMGILNVTPDSFSDGGKFNQVSCALFQAEKMISAGATFVDVGGESTRPGAKAVSLQEELDRVIPVIEKISSEIDCIVSIDTSKARVMQEACSAGALLINDVRALREDGSLKVASELAISKGIPSCIMHMKGTPKDMQDNPSYDDLDEELYCFFERKIDSMLNNGFKKEQIIVDPGFGFGKTLEHNYHILKHLYKLTQFGVPVLAGMSRKSMIGTLLGKEVDQRLFGDIASHTIAAMNGANILRVHDVPAIMDAVKIVSKINSLH